MNSFNKILAFSMLAVGMSFSLASVAQSDMDQGQAAISPVTLAMTDGLVKKMDPDNGKLTIKHGEIKHLDMPGMTMVFTVKDKALLAPVKVGDKIRFMVVDEGGKLIITDIQPAQ